MTIGAGAANRLLRLMCLPQAWSLRRACRDVRAAQEATLLRILRRNAGSEFGRRFSFASIRSAREFQQRVPLSEPGDYAEPVRRIAEGASGVLTSAPVLLLEPTSGSSSPSKWIPYTADLRREFSRALGAWLWDLYGRWPSLLDGPAYWSMSPALRRPVRSAGGVRIGFEDDAEYFGPAGRMLVRSLLAVPPEVQAVTDLGLFRAVTLLFLLRAGELRLFSVWNPSFLTVLLGPLAELGPGLARHIGAGTLPAGLEPSLARALEPLNPPAPERAEALMRLFASSRDAASLTAGLWPRLALISCWADGAAAGALPPLRRLFPGVPVQGKGLLATEGAVTVPFGEGPGCPALRSHFFEFLPEERGAPLLAHELEPGRRYTVVLTTGGGLYRYRLGDVVEAVEVRGSCPRLRFVGRQGVSDRAGEKLSEVHAREALARSLAGSAGVSFAMLAYEGAAYVLFAEAPALADPELLRLGSRVEDDLRRNFHYDYARRLGQLGPLGVFRVERGAGEAYLERCAGDGQCLGGVKPSALHLRSGWKDVFEGRFLVSDVKKIGGPNEPVIPCR